MDAGSKKRLIIAACCMAGIIVLSVIFAFITDGIISPSALTVIDFLSALVILLILMAVNLKASLEKTLYSYENVAYIGGILFTFILLVTDSVSLISSLCSGEEVTVKNIFHSLTDFPENFSYFAVPVMIFVCLLLGVSNIALIRHEGFRPKNLLSVLLGAFYIGGTAAIYFASHLLETKVLDSGDNLVFQVLNTYIPMFFILIMCYFECILAGCAVMGFAAARKIPDYDKDYIIILGCSIDKKGGLLPLLKGRANRAIRFAWDQEIATGKRCLYVPSGGQGPGEVMSEGSAMELYLLSHGAENDEVFPEKESSDTYENMLFSKRIIDSLSKDAKIAFATTNFHVFRSGIIARRAGLDVEGISSGTKWYFWPNGFIREFFGILSINRKAHIMTAAVIGACCAVLGLVSYFFNLV